MFLATPWSGETLKKGRPKVILIAEYLLIYLNDVRTWS